MNNLSLILALLFQVQDEQVLTVSVNNIKSDAGYIMIAVYDEEDHFLTRNVAISGKYPVSKAGSLNCKLKMPHGRYAISIYHDADSDGRLGTNFFKIPNEPVGFSNNASALFGPPSFEKAVFSFDQNHSLIKIKLN